MIPVERPMSALERFVVCCVDKSTGFLPEPWDEIAAAYAVIAAAYVLRPIAWV